MAETQIVQAWLGIKPFVLVEITGAETDDNDEVTALATDVRFGGGVVEGSGDDDLNYLELLAMVLQGAGWKLTTPAGEVFE